MRSNRKFLVQLFGVEVRHRLFEDAGRIGQQNSKFDYRNSKWFDKLTTLSNVEGQL
jgi:hypothetical protein